MRGENASVHGDRLVYADGSAVPLAESCKHAVGGIAWGMAPTAAEKALGVHHFHPGHVMVYACRGRFDQYGQPLPEPKAAPQQITL